MAIQIIIGFMLVLVLGLAFYFGGAMIVARMQQAKITGEVEHRFEDKQPAQQELQQQFDQNRAQKRAEQTNDPEQPGLPPPL